MRQLIVRAFGALIGGLMLLGTIAPLAISAQDSPTPTANTGSSGATAQGSTDTVPISDAEVAARNELANKYAPIVSLRTQARECDRSGEGYFPAPIETVLGTPDVVLKQRTGRNASQDTVIKTAPTAQDLVGLGADFYLDWPGNPVRPGCDFERWFRQRVAEMGAVPTTYAHFVVDTEHNVLFLQYWFWYTFNDWNNTHEGDWEMVQLRFPTTLATEALNVLPDQVSYAQHGGGELADWDDAKISREGDHLVAFPAAGSHGTFYGSHIYIGWGEDGAGFGCDVTSSPQARNTMAVVVIPDQIDPAGPFAWLLFGGRWGERAPSIWDGPLGPNMNMRWTDPYAAIANWRTTSLRIPTSTLMSGTATDLFCTLSKHGSVLVTRIVTRPLLLILTLIAIIGGIWWLVRTCWYQVRLAWEAYEQDWQVYAKIGLLSIPIAILFNIIDLWVRSRPPVEFLIRWFNDTAGARLSLALAIGGLQQIVTLLLIAPPVIQTIVDRRNGLVPTFRGSIERSFHHIPRLAVALLIVILFVSVLSITLIGIPIAIYLAIAWQYVGQAKILDDCDKPAAAMLRSREVVGRDLWFSAKTSLLFQGFAWVPGPLVGALLLIFGKAGVNLANGFSGVVYALTVPVAIIGLTQAYSTMTERRRERANGAAPDSESPDKPTPSPATPV
ncbi:MAG TPA: hypothetical protein PK819_07030 [Thermomicrobiales bacterium]|nr:hypothetical protein [Thermomicrobiales bacterium]